MRSLIHRNHSSSSVCPSVYLSITLLKQGTHTFLGTFSLQNNARYISLSPKVFCICSQIRADPSDINVLPEYNKDPRVVKNLVDGINRTRDDVHMWLAPFNVGSDHLVFCTFDKPCKVALIRIWVSFKGSECI